MAKVKGCHTPVEYGQTDRRSEAIEMWRMEKISCLQCLIKLPITKFSEE